jgi:ElaB/YqjD/DUF883 family membrane-anchored ribosome-binding protein
MTAMADDRKRDVSAAPDENQGGTKTSAAKDRTELDSLTRQVDELREQMQRFLSESAGATLRRAGDAVKDNLAGAIDASLKNRPYTTLAMGFGLGFLFARLK